VFYGVLDIRNGTLEYCNCGHNAPLVLDAAGNITTLPATGLPLGVYPDFSATAHTISLSPEDLLVLFTDGVTEAMNTVDEEFTDERLQETLLAARNLGTEEIVDRVFHEVDGFAQGAEQADDITCFVLRRLPPGKAS
jgi:sigma-B regulation protein RsbU (phosphoserine phosphatase)